MVPCRALKVTLALLVQPALQVQLAKRDPLVLLVQQARVLLVQQVVLDLPARLVKQVAPARLVPRGRPAQEQRVIRVLLVLLEVPEALVQLALRDLRGQQVKLVVLVEPALQAPLAQLDLPERAKLVLQVLQAQLAQL